MAPCTAPLKDASRRTSAVAPARAGAILDRGCARRRGVVRPGRRNGPFQPNKETWAGGWRGPPWQGADVSTHVQQRGSHITIHGKGSMIETLRNRLEAAECRTGRFAGGFDRGRVVIDPAQSSRERRPQIHSRAMAKKPSGANQFLVPGCFDPLENEPRPEAATLKHIAPAKQCPDVIGDRNRTRFPCRNSHRVHIRCEIETPPPDVPVRQNPMDACGLQGWFDRREGPVHHQIPNIPITRHVLWREMSFNRLVQYRCFVSQGSTRVPVLRRALDRLSPRGVARQSRSHHFPARSSEPTGNRDNTRASDFG